MGSRHRRDRQRWLVVQDHQVVDRIYDCDLEEAHRVSLRKWGAGARLTAWRYASAEQRAAALRVPITHYADDLEVLRAHFERPRAMSAGGAR